MPLPPYRRPFAGAPLSGASARRVLRDVEALSDVSGTGDIGIEEGAGGRQILDARPKPIPARITAHVAGNAYAFVRVDDGAGDGTFPDMEGTTEEGDGESLVAWELNGREDVEADTLVHLVPNLLGPGYTFAASGGCCGYGTDLYTDDNTDYDGEIGGDGVVIAAGSANNQIALSTFVKVPAGSGRVTVSGGVLVSWYEQALGLNWSVRVYVSLAEVDEYGAYVTDASAWQPGLWAAIDDTASLVNFPKGRHGDYSSNSYVANGAGFAKRSAVEVDIDVGEEDRYFAWQYGYVSTIAGTLQIWHTGLGVTRLGYEKRCCADSPTAPTEGSGSGSGPTVDELCCSEELSGADLVATADGDDYTLTEAVPGLWQAIDLSESVTFLRVACLSGTWYAWSTVDSVHHGPIEADSAACEPFSATFDGPALGFADPVTVEAA